MTLKEIIKQDKSGNATALIIKYMLLFVLFVFVLPFFGCSGPKRVPTEPVVLENAQLHQSDNTRVSVVHDTLREHHYHEVLIKGDSVFIHDSIDRVTKVFVHDTLKCTDTCYVRVEVPAPYPEPYEVVKEKEVPVRGFFWWAGLAAVLAAAGYVGYKVYRLWRKVR